MFFFKARKFQPSLPLNDSKTSRYIPDAARIWISAKKVNLKGAWTTNNPTLATTDVSSFSWDSPVTPPVSSFYQSSSLGGYPAFFNKGYALQGPYPVETPKLTILNYPSLTNWLLLQFLVNSPIHMNSTSSFGLMYTSLQDLTKFSHFNFSLNSGYLTKEVLKYVYAHPYLTVRPGPAYLTTTIPKVFKNVPFKQRAFGSDMGLNFQYFKYAKKTIFEKNNIWKKQYLKKNLVRTAAGDATKASRHLSIGVINTILTKLYLHTGGRAKPFSDKTSRRATRGITVYSASPLLARKKKYQDKLYFSILAPLPLRSTRGVVAPGNLIARVDEHLLPRGTNLQTADFLTIPRPAPILFTIRRLVGVIGGLHAQVLSSFMLAYYFPLFWKLALPSVSKLGILHQDYSHYYYAEYVKVGVAAPTTSFKTNTNLVPALNLRKYFIKQISSPLYLNYFTESGVITWTYHFFIRFLEFCTGKKILLQVYSFINQNISIEFSALYKKWIPRMGFYEKRLGHKFFFEESLHILHLGFTLRDARLISTWLKSLIQRISFWKTRLIFRFIKYLFQNYFTYLFPRLDVHGLKIKLKGKISAAGNSRKRTVLYRKGRTSHATVGLRVIHEFCTITTFTGVMGLQIWVFY